MFNQGRLGYCDGRIVEDFNQQRELDLENEKIVNWKVSNRALLSVNYCFYYISNLMV